MRTLIVIIMILSLGSAFAGWTPAERISDERTVFNPRIVSNGDYLHVVYWGFGGGTNQAFYLRSTDKGNIWESPFLLPDTSITFANAMPIVKVLNNNVISLWKNYFIDGWGRNISFGKSTNAGQTWQPVTYIISSNNYVFQKHAMCVSDSDIYVIFSHSGNGLRFEFTKSTNWGQTWSEPEELFTALHSGRFDMACGDDTVHFFWSGAFTHEEQWEIYYTKSTDGGDNWSENYLISEFDSIGSQNPSVSINESGEMILCWLDGKYSPHPWNGDLFVRYSYDSGDSWTEEEQITFTHWAVDPRIIWHNDSIHVTWEDDRHSQQDIFYMLSTDNGFTWGEQQRVDDDPGLSNGPDLALTGDNVHIVWNDFREYDQGRGVYYSRWEPDISVEEKSNNTLPEDIFLQAYPNPFNSTTLITYKNVKGGDIEIYNLSGQLVKTISIQGKEGKIAWDAADASGEKITSGIYFVRARTPQGFTTIKLVYLK